MLVVMDLSCLYRGTAVLVHRLQVEECVSHFLSIKCYILVVHDINGENALSNLLSYAW